MGLWGSKKRRDRRRSQKSRDAARETREREDRILEAARHHGASQFIIEQAGEIRERRFQERYGK